jgi:membrane fusion protein, macrolide-specific efflux system
MPRGAVISSVSMGNNGWKRAVKRTALPLAVLLLGTCRLFPKEEKILAPPLMSPPEVSYSVTEAKKGTIEQRTRGGGTFVAVNQHSLYFRYRSGRIRRIAVAVGDEVKAGTLLAELDIGSLENRIAQARLQLRKTELLAERSAALNRDKYERELASIDVEMARLQLQDLQTELEQSRLYAPISGVVVYIAKILEGDAVDAYRTIAQVADPRKLQLHYKGDKAADFRLGSKVEVAFRDRTYSGEVVMTPGTIPYDANEEMKGSILVNLSALPPEAARGDTAGISLLLDRRENVIVLPRDVVHTYLGRSYVQVMEDGIKRERTVEVGIQNATEAEIVKGLQVGEKVIER